MSRFVRALLFISVLAPQGAAFAQKGAAKAAPPVGPDGKPQGSGVKIERGSTGKKVYRITEEIKIEGKIQKPEAFYVLQKSSINYDWQELKQDFLPKIIDSVSKAPF